MLYSNPKKNTNQIIDYYKNTESINQINSESKN